QRIGGAHGLHPGDRDAVLGELLLEQALVLEQDRDRVVGRPIDPNVLGLVGSQERARKERDRERGGGERTSEGGGHDELHPFAAKGCSRRTPGRATLNIIYRTAIIAPSTHKTSQSLPHDRKI